MAPKRPRIRPELDRAIEHARGLVPLEPWVNDVIERELRRLAQKGDLQLAGLLEEDAAVPADE